MPYIARKDRAQYQKAIAELAKLVPPDRMARPGHMNYVISLLIQRVYLYYMIFAEHNYLVCIMK